MDKVEERRRTNGLGVRQLGVIELLGALIEQGDSHRRVEAADLYGGRVGSVISRPIIISFIAPAAFVPLFLSGIREDVSPNGMFCTFCRIALWAVVLITVECGLYFSANS